MPTLPRPTLSIAATGTVGSRVRPGHFIARIVRVVALAALAAPCFGCGRDAPPRAVPTEAAGLPAYLAADAAVFDDNFAPEVFGLVPPSRSDDDGKLAERLERADSVVRAQISTVTSDRQKGGVPNYQLVLRAVGPGISGRPTTEPIAVGLSSSSPSYPLVAASEETLVGRVVVFFFRRYNEKGNVAIHWHAEADTERTAAAIARARLLGEARARK